VILLEIDQDHCKQACTLAKIDGPNNSF